MLPLGGRTRDEAPFGPRGGALWWSVRLRPRAGRSTLGCGARVRARGYQTPPKARASTRERTCSSLALCSARARTTPSDDVTALRVVGTAGTDCTETLFVLFIPE